VRHSNGNPPRTAEPHGPLNIAKKRIFGVIYSERKNIFLLIKAPATKNKNNDHQPETLLMK
jgi:hypothetical protein